ncbi:cyclic nucleotide-binding protein [Salinisphaera sp. PC39]|uniref:MMPL family transporter n=1 Tax=Salinisphaera sp. PC39 TaxID=1304156 RepID=UPI0033400AF8
MTGDRLAGRVARHPLLIAALVAVVTALAAVQLTGWPVGTSRLVIDPSLEALLPLDNEERRYLDRVESVFGHTEAVVAAVYVEDAFTPANLAAVARMTERLRARSWVSRVWSLAAAPDLRADGDALDLGGIAAAGVTPAEAAALRTAVRSNPLYADTLISGDGATALVVYLRPAYEDAPGTGDAVREIRRILEDDAGGAEVRLSGPPVVKAATGEALMRELGRILPSLFVLVAVILAAAFRSVRGVLLPAAVIGTILIWTLAVLAVGGRPLNLITAIVPPVTVVIGLAYALHFLSAYYRVAPEGGADGVRRTLLDIALPLIMTGATTAAGFLALTLSPLQPIREFGWLSAVGVLIAVFLSLTLLPSLLILFGCRRLSGPPALKWFADFAEWLGRFNLRHRRTILAAGGLLLAVSAIGSLQIRAGTDYIQGFAPDHPVRADFQRIGADFGGATPLSVVLESPVADTFARPDVLRAVAGFQDWLEAQPEVGAVTSLVDYLTVLNRAMGGAEDAALPDDRRTVKQLLLLGGGDTLDGLADGGLTMTHLRVRARVSDSEAIESLVARIRDRMAALPPPVTGRVTGTPVLMTNAVDAIVSGQAVTVGAALLVVFLLLSALFTSLRVGLITLVPNLLPVMAYFGALGLAGISLNPTTSLIACIVLGIAVDDTLYYFARFNRDARDLADEARATRSALSTVIRPMTYSSLALVAGFLVLTASDLQNQVQFGALAAFTVAVAWLTDVTFTPALASRVRIVTLWDLLRLDLGHSPQQSIPLFEGLSLRQARIFALLSRMQTFRAGERVLSEGDEAGDIFVVIDGELRAWVAREGETVELSRMRRGAVMGEVGHFAKRRTANVDAVSDVRLLRFDSADLDRLRRRSPRIAALVFRNLNAIQARRLAETTQLLR